MFLLHQVNNKLIPVCEILLKCAIVFISIAFNFFFYRYVVYSFSRCEISSSPSSDIEDAELVGIGKSMESTLDLKQSTSEKDQKCTQPLSSPLKEPVTVKTLSQLRSNISVQPGMYMFYTVFSFAFTLIKKDFVRMLSSY
jgi:hypothetical protein